MGCAQSTQATETDEPKTVATTSKKTQKVVVVKKAGGSSAPGGQEEPAEQAPSSTMPFLSGKETVPEEKHPKLPPEARSITAKDKKKNILENLEGVIRLKKDGDEDFDIIGGFVLTQQRIMSYAYGVKHLDIKFTDGRIHKMLFLWESDHLGENKVFIIQLPAELLDKSLSGDAEIRWNTPRAEELCGVVTNLHVPEPDPEDVRKRHYTNPDVKLYR